MILITGATGTVGGLVLARMPPGLAVRVLVRRPDGNIPQYAGADVLQGDYADDASLQRALSGVRRALLVTTGVEGDEDERFLHAARRAGTEHVVKLSAAAVLGENANDLITCWQRRTEQLLRTSGLAWTLLRPRAFMSNTLSWAPGVRAEGVVRSLYGRAASACVDPRDVADSAVAALTGCGHAGRAYTLTGPLPITAVDQTEQLGAALGRRLKCVEITEEEGRAALSRRYPEPIVEALLESARRRQGGAKEATGPALEKLLGRQARSFASWAVDHATSFTDEPATTPAAPAGR
jgi:uncharacterized protein YbjT (DUF2867 family)